MSTIAGGEELTSDENFRLLPRHSIKFGKDSLLAWIRNSK